MSSRTTTALSSSLAAIMRSPRLGESAFAPVTTRIALSRGISTFDAVGAAAVTPSFTSTKQRLESFALSDTQ